MLRARAPPCWWWWWSPDSVWRRGSSRRPHRPPPPPPRLTSSSRPTLDTEKRQSSIITTNHKHLVIFDKILTHSGDIKQVPSTTVNGRYQIGSYNMSSQNNSSRNVIEQNGSATSCMLFKHVPSFEINESCQTLNALQDLITPSAPPTSESPVNNKYGRMWAGGIVPQYQVY